MAMPISAEGAHRRTTRDPQNLAELYGLPILDWDSVAIRLAQGVTQAPGSGGPDGHTCWLATINRDGSPHVTGVGALWADGAFWFETGAQTLKGRNLARDPRCTVSLATLEFDLVVDGIAVKITDRATVAVMAEGWSVAGWPARVDETGVGLTADYTAPSAGPPPWSIYRLTSDRATAIQTIEPGGATRWDLRAR